MKDEWYVSRGGKRFGPVDFNTLVESARAGRLEPRSDLVIGGGLADWVPSGEVEGIFERSEAGESAAAAVGADGSLAATGSYQPKEAPRRLELPGAPRLGYILGVTVLPVILGIGLAKLLPTLQGFVGQDYARFVPLVLLVIPVLVIVITVKRFQNLGMSGWWLLGLLVPFLNWWLNYRLIACPPGYVFTRKLDVWGWILAVLYWLALVGWLVVGILYIAVVIQRFDTLMESGEFDKWREIWQEMMKSPPAR